MRLGEFLIAEKKYKKAKKKYLTIPSFSITSLTFCGRSTFTHKKFHAYDTGNIKT
jgi:hypothetical protein